MDITKKRTLEDIDKTVDFLVKKRIKYEGKCSQLQCDDFLYDDCDVDKKLRNIEDLLITMRNQIACIKSDVNTWSYTIMGNKEAELL